MLESRTSSPTAGARRRSVSSLQPLSDRLFVRTFRRLRLPEPIPEFEAAYYPYAGIRHSIHLKEGRIRVKISDLLKEASPVVLEAVAEILLCRLFRIRISREAQACYREFLSRPHVQQRAQHLRRQRGRKQIAPPQGQAYNLEEIFRRLNKRFFSNRLTDVGIGWSERRSRKVLGHFDPAHRVIVISRLLDSHRTPRLALEFLVYHEMLHLKYPPAERGGRRQVHSKEFRQAERRFPQAAEARRRLKRIC